MNKVFTFYHDRTNAPYILPEGLPHYPFGNDYSGHGHPSVAAFMQRFTNPERSDENKQLDLEYLKRIRDMQDWGDRYARLPRDFAMAASLLSFLIHINSGKQTIHEALGTNFDQLGIKEVLVRAMGWSALERFPHHTVTTAVPDPNLTFFDYRLMGYRINQVPQLVWDKESRTYNTYTAPSYMLSQAERDATEEIELIDQEFPLAEWWPEIDVYTRCPEPRGCDQCEADHRGNHLINGQNSVTRQLARRAAFFRNVRESEDVGYAWSPWQERKSTRPYAALGNTDTPHNDHFILPETARHFGIPLE